MTELTGLLDGLRASVAGGDLDQARPIARELAVRASEDFPTLHAALDLLDYHGELALINDVMAQAWRQVQEATGYSHPAVAAYASRAGDHLIYQHLEEAPAATTDTTSLQILLERYFEVDGARLQIYLSFLAGEAGRRWSPDDFRANDATALSGLVVEFVGLAHRTGISYGKAHLVREHLPRYFLDRQAGYLHPREDVAALLRSGQRPPPVVTGQPAHPLLPDQLTLRNFLEKMVQTVAPQVYPAAAIVELMPIWLRFLDVRQLAAAELLHDASAELEGLAAEFAPVWHESGDAVLIRNLLEPAMRWTR